MRTQFDYRRVQQDFYYHWCNRRNKTKGPKHRNCFRRVVAVSTGNRYLLSQQRASKLCIWCEEVEEINFEESPKPGETVTGLFMTTEEILKMMNVLIYIVLRCTGLFGASSVELECRKVIGI